MGVVVDVGRPVVFNIPTIRADFMRGRVVLVVDDEPLIRELVGRMLHVNGCRAIAAQGGDEAIELYANHRDEIALVLMDVQMPGLNGPETLRELRQMDPDVRCCFMSGDTGIYSSDELNATGALHVFAKPFRMHELMARLRELLEV